MFNGRERVASFVIRWSTTPRLRDQSVADHSFYVALYSNHICDILRVTPERRAEVLEWALYHDLPENVTGDMPGPVKRRLIDRDALDQLEGEILNEMDLGAPETGEFAQLVVKCANLVDEVFYLQNERNLGNKYVEHVFANSWQRLRRAADKIGVWYDIEPMLKGCLDRMEGGIVGVKTPEDTYVVSTDDEIPF